MIRVRALGQNVIEVKRRSIRPDAELLFATLLYLAGERGRRVERETIAALFWPRDSAARRRHSLRQILYKLRRLGVNTGTTADALTIPASDVWLDFEDADASEDREMQRELAAPGGVRCLPAYAPAMSKAFSDWLDGFRARAESAARRRLVAAIGHARRAGRWEEVEPLARNCLQIDPLNEEATLALAEAIALAGAKSKAVAMLDAYMMELGPHAGDIKLPATVLRRRIADQLGTRRLKGPLETKLIGREDVMEVLTAALEKTKTGHAATHVVWGVSGIGKTRVLEEVMKLAALMGATTVMQRAAPDDEHTPGLTLVRLARAMLAAPGSLGLAPDVLALLQRLTAQRPEPSSPRPTDVSEDALVRAMVDLERSLAWERPLLAVLDDSHHADELTRRVLSRAQGCLTSERVLLLMASVEEPPSSGLGHITAFRVKRLEADACTRLTRALVEKAGADYDDAVIDSLATASGGHPFVLREAVIACVQNGERSPAVTLEQVLQRRHARLTDEAREVLLSALVLAEHATLALLVRDAPLKEAVAERAIIELEGEQILVCSGDGRVAVHNLWLSSVENLYPVSHVLLRRLRIARLLETASFEVDTAERLVASASHFQRAGDGAGAARALARGGIALQDRALAPAAYAVFSRAADLDPSSDEFEHCLLQSLIAARQADLVDEAVALVERFGARLHASSRLSEPEKTELEIIGVELRHTELNEIEDSGTCLSILRRPGLTEIQRLRVALTGVRWAEQNHDPPTVQQIVRLISTVPLNTSEADFLRRQIAMVEAMSSRRIADARALADADFAEAVERPLSRERVRSSLNNRLPFYFDCDFERVEEIVVHVRDQVRHYSSTFLALRTEDVYATHCIDVMRLDEAAELIALAVERATRFGHKYLRHNFLELLDRLGVARGESLIDPNFDSGTIRSGAGKHARIRAFPLCNLAVRAARSANRSVLRLVEPELTECWDSIKRGCPFDYPCLALAITKAALGRASEGTAVVSDYFMSSRVTKNTPSPFVLALAREFGVPLI